MSSTLASLRGSSIAIIRSTGSAEALAHAATAVARGYPIIEVTWTTPGAATVVRDLVAAGHTVGAGTILRPDEADEAIDAGATFLVAPSHPSFLLERSAEAGVLAVPGVATPGELQTALDAGAELVKLFPAARLGGPAYVRDLLGPFPSALLMCSGGVKQEEAGDYFAAGAYCLGMSVR